MRKLLAIASALVLTLAACSASADAAPTVGCAETASEELYVAKMYECTDTRVYTFSDAKAREHWVQVAQEFGTVVISNGDTWVTVKRD